MAVYSQCILAPIKFDQSRSHVLWHTCGTCRLQQSSRVLAAEDYGLVVQVSSQTLDGPCHNLGCCGSMLVLHIVRPQIRRSL